MDLINGLRQRFNSAELANGVYQIAVVVGQDTVVKTFVVGEQHAQKLVSIRS